MLPGTIKSMESSRSRILAISIFFVLLTLFALTGVRLVYTHWQNKKSVSNALEKTAKGTVVLPVPIENPRVGSAFLHYFFRGKIKEIQNIANGSQIILEDANSALPPFVIIPTTRISLIAPPYNASTVSPIPLSKLQPGIEVELSMEYDLRSTTWRVQDVFIPTDRNPELTH